MPTFRKAFTLTRPDFSGINGNIDHRAMGWDTYGIGEQGALRIAACWIATTLIADEVSTLKWRIIAKDDQARRTVQPPRLAPLWDKPNPDDVPLTWRQQTTLSVALHGVSYTMLSWDNGGGLDELVPLDASNCSLARLDDGGLELKPGTKPPLRNHPKARPEFMAIPLFKLAGQLEPLSPVKYAAQLLGLSAEYDAAARRLMANGLNPSAVLTVGEPIEEGPAEKLGSRLMRLNSGRNSGGVAVLGGPDLKLEKWSMSMVDAQFVAQNDRVFSLVMAMWRVPPTVVGMVDKPSTWGTGVAEFSRGLERFTTRPYVERIQAGVEDAILKWVAPNLQWRAYFDSLLSASPKDRAEVQRLSLGNGLTSVERVLAQNDEAPFGEDETVFSPLSQASDEDRRLDRLKKQSDVYGGLIRAGVAPESAAAVAGFDPAALRSLGLRPVTLAVEPVQDPAAPGGGTTE